MLGKVEYKTLLVGKAWIIGISFEEEVSFLPGQFVSLKVNEEGLRRSYSVASLPDGKKIELLIDVSPMGVGSQYVLGLKVGETVEILGFLGKFVVGEEEIKEQRELLFVGTGSGIAPLKPMIEDLLINKKYKEKIDLFWGMRFETDLYWIGEMDRLQREYDNFHFKIVLSKPGEDWPGERGHVGDVIEKKSINGKENNAYLCGNPEMISEVKEILVNNGVPDGQILYERYA